jgi:hypothetical protein
MRKIYLFIIVLLIATTTNAQIAKDKMLVGGLLSSYSNKTDYQNSSQKYNNAVIGLSLGKLIKENKVLGVNVSFSPFKQINQSSSTNEIKGNTTNIGIFYRQYKALGKGFYFFGEGEGGFTGSNRKETATPGGSIRETKSTGVFFGFTPGVSYQAYKKFFIDLSLPGLLNMRYLDSKFTDKTNPNSNSQSKEFLFTSNLQSPSVLGNLGIGVRFLL